MSGERQAHTYQHTLSTQQHATPHHSTARHSKQNLTWRCALKVNRRASKRTDVSSTSLLIMQGGFKCDHHDFVLPLSRIPLHSHLPDRTTISKQ